MTEIERIQSHRDAVRRHSAKYRPITIRPTKEQAALIAAAAEQAGMSVQAYALEAVLRGVGANAPL